MKSKVKVEQAETRDDSDVPQYVRTEAAAKILGLAPNTLAKWRGKGRGPSFRKFGKVVAYRISDLRSWAEAATPASTATV